MKILHLFLLLLLIIVVSKVTAQKDSVAIENLIQLAREYSDDDRCQDAIPIYQKVLQYQQNLWGKDNVYAAKTYNRIGNCQDELGAYDDAIKSHQLALEMRQKLLGKEHYDVGTSYKNMGVSYRRKGLYSKALECQLIALDNRIRTKGSEHIKTAYSYENVAICYEMLGDYDRSISYYEKALAIEMKELGEEHRYVSELYNNIGGCWRLRNQYDKALDYFRKAKQIRLKISGDESRQLGDIYNNMANCYRYLDCSSDALIYANQALEIREKVLPKGHPSIAKTYETIGKIYLKNEEYKKAITPFRKCLDLVAASKKSIEMLIPESYHSLGIVELKLGNLANALALCDSAYWALNLPIHITNENIWEVPKLSIDIYGTIANAYLKKYYQDSDIENLKVGLQMTRESIKLIDHFRWSYQGNNAKVLLNSEVLSIYEDAITICKLLYQKDANISYLNEAFVFMEKSKSMVLQDALRLSNAKSFAGLPDTLLQQEQELQEQIAQLERDKYQLVNQKPIKQIELNKINHALFKYRYQLSEFATQLEKQFPDYHALKYDTTVIQLAEIQQYLVEDQSMIEYFVGDSSVFILVINKNEAYLHQQNKNFSLEDLVQDFQKSIYIQHLHTNVDSTYAQVAFYLYESLWKPIEPLINERVIVVPANVLGYLPFAALLKELPTDYTSYQNYPYLLHDYHISYSHAASLYPEYLRPRRKGTTINLLAFAPSFASKQALAVLDDTQRARGQLKFNLQEVEAIHEIWGGKVMEGNEASKKNFLDLAPKSKLLHLATHGKTDEKSGEFAYLVFSPSEPDHLVYLRELYSLRLNAEMVVLSACETGIGPLQKGEGVISLARGFIYSGAQSIITTLWRVSDKSSASLMTSFYQELEQEKTKDAALREAQIDYIQSQPARLAHPFYWAAYIPIGNMNVISPKNNFLLYILLIGIILSVLMLVKYIPK